jgi:hypothetical protein
MVQSTTSSTTTSTFVLRFWREWTGTEARWRGRIEHVQSGRRADFLAVEDLLGFFQPFGIGLAVRAVGRTEDTPCAKDA